MDLLEKPAVLERRHPWEVTRFHFLSGLLRQSLGLKNPVRILDVGAGDAWFAQRLMEGLPEKSEIVCWDQGYGDSPNSKAGPLDARVRFTRERPRETFNVLLLLDVLEHITLDRAFLKDTVSQNAAAGSFFLVTVPSWPWLFSAHDVHLKHVRRYRSSECRALVASADLALIGEGYFFHALLMARACAVLGERLGIKKTPKDLGQWTHGPWMTRLVTSALTMDNRLSGFFSRQGWLVPGLSYWALCQKKTSL